MNPRNHAIFLTQCLVLMRRSFVNMYRNLGYYWMRFAVYLTVAWGLGTIYYNVGSSYDSIQVFERERLNGHYGSGAFVISNTLSSSPYLLLISLVPGAIVYYLTRLSEGFDHFAYFSLVIFTCMMLVESLMMIIASIVPNYLMGIITGAGVRALMILGGGFFRLPGNLPIPFWKYPLYYIAFHKYAYQGLFKNEFEGEIYHNNQGGRMQVITGEQVLRNTWQVELEYSKWIDLAILFGMVGLYRLLFFTIIKTTEQIKPAVRAFMSAPKNKS